MKFAKSRSSENRKRSLTLLVALVLLLWISFLATSRHYFMSISRLKILLMIVSAPATLVIQRPASSNPLGDVTQIGKISACIDSKKGLCVKNIANSALHEKDSDRATNLELQRRPMCDVSGPRSVVCELEGDIRIHGNSSSIIVAGSDSVNTSESWRVRPYARKNDAPAMRKVGEVSLRGGSSSSSATALPRCTVNHSVPGIVFSTGGHAGNIFHDFSDMLIPLYLTSNQYHGEVQLLITDMKPWFLSKHQRLLSRLSHHNIIDFDNDHDVHCFSNVIIGLRCHKDFNIDPSMPPLGFSMANFTKFLKNSYSLERESINCREFSRKRKPRLLLITRKWSRTYSNAPQIVEAIESVGFEVVVRELSWTASLAEVANTVNSCDVLVGVHGAGLTNLVFLPAGAVMIQVVPWGMGTIAYVDYGRPAEHAELNYLQYEISLEESSLIEEYPRDHHYIKDPSSVHKKGWYAVRDAYLNHNVSLDLKRFAPLLLEAMKRLQSCS